MKYTHVCPKCRSADIVRVPGYVGAYGSGSHIPVGMFTTSAVPVSRYVCVTCGFVEDWVDAPQGLAKLRDKYGPAGPA